MLGYRLPGHVEVRAQFPERLPVALVQLIEQLPAAFVRQRLEHCIHLASHYATIWLHVKRQTFHDEFSLLLSYINLNQATVFIVSAFNAAKTKSSNPLSKSG